MEKINSAAAFRQWVSSGFIRKWVIIGIFIGIIAGVGSLALYYAIALSTRYILTGITGFTPPGTALEGQGPVYILGTYRYWLLPLSTTLGGLVSGLLVYGLAPEAEGHGTDAAIEAFHYRKGYIRKRIPAVKLVASAITIGSGGSAGREGPVAQIAAGFGSFIADIFGLDDRDRRIAVAAGIGAGIGSIFMAPLGGALLSTEVLYKRDFEVDALVPSIIASATGYAIFGYFFNYRPLFSIQQTTVGFYHPESLILYTLVGIITGLCGIFYVVTFYGLKKQFVRLKIPKYFKPAIGGLGVGLIAMAFPQVVGLSYGWLQLIFYGGTSQFTEFAIMPLGIIIVLIFMKIIATSLSIGSGGSGGVYAPGIVIGGFIGAAIWLVFHPLMPYLSIADVVIVSMISFFGGVSKAPISIIIMGTEMTGGYALFLPLMLATVISYFISGSKYSIYRAQVLDRAHSPAHQQEYEKPLMDYIKVSEAMASDISTLDAGTTLEEAIRLMKQLRTKGAVVLSVNEIMSFVSMDEAVKSAGTPGLRLRDVATRAVKTISSEQSAHDVFNLLTTEKLELLVVLEKRNETEQIVGVIGLQEIAKAYNEKIRSLALETERNEL